MARRNSGQQILEERSLRETSRSLLADEKGVGSIVADRLKEVLRQRLSETLSSAPRAFRREVDAAVEALDLEATKDLTLRALIQKLAPKSLEDGGKGQQKGKELLERLPDDLTVGALLYLDVPLGKNPLFASLAARSRQHRLLQMTALGNDPRRMRELLALIEKDRSSVWAILQRWRDEQVVGQAAISDVAATLELADATGGNLELLPSLRQRGVQSVEQLAGYTAAKWLAILHEDGIEPPMDSGGQQLSLQDYAQRLTAAVGRAAPTAVFIHRLTERGKPLENDLRTVAAFLSPRPEANSRVARSRGSIGRPSSRTTGTRSKPPPRAWAS